MNATPKMLGGLMNSSLILVIAGLTLGLASPTHSQQTTVSVPTSERPASGRTEPLAQTAANDPEYRIGPQDVLRIDVWKEAEISRVVPVRPDGKISLPLLNDVQAAGLTTIQLSAVISEGLK